MEAAGSEGDNNGRTADGSVKPKRQMKTPFQLEALERTYAAEMYPSEATRAELSVQLGLSDRQLQMWFCHRRLKDKKEGAAKKQLDTPGARKGSFESRTDELKVAELGRDDGSGSRSGSGSGSGSDSSQFNDNEDMPSRRRYYELSPRSVMVQRVISCVEAQLGGPVREDGPILGVDFDEMPPGANRTSIGRMEHWGRSRNSHDGHFHERSKPSISKASLDSYFESAELNNKADGYRKSSSHSYDFPLENPSLNRSSSMPGNGQWSRQYGAQVQASGVSQFSHQGKQEQFLSSPMGNESFQNAKGPLPLGKKRKNEDDKIDTDVSHGKKNRRELEKEDVLRKKREEQIKKEMEKQDREKRREEDRLLREKLRMQQKNQREEKREHERREKFLQRELLKVERRKQMEELRREKEAARQKITMERAALRRIAKESLELIEDERLELMELAASRKGLPSIVSLDYETLQNLESYRDHLCTFPPKSVHLKKPFSFEPWLGSEENIGNLLMVWRFCITFSDVLGIWPFTLDEFIQAFHDYDSRLLAEIHIALLKLVVRDIEEGARTQSSGTGTNQYTAANPEGGHPHIVEGAFNWGFDIHNWKKHLNPLTWPEILRQFALSAGYGPRLSNESAESTYLHDKNEIKGCEDIVSMLRNGSAVENAVMLMKEKGPHQRKNRNRLTPGTIKFAAYHVLCLEGSKGLTLIELADKIQRSGLRDLSTSKTPDATVSVALSRDPTLFVRIAPLTYCVRPSFRKDPADGEAILAAAKEEIHKYVNGFLTEETNDDVEKDEESESDMADGPEVDEIGTPVNLNKISDNLKEPGVLSATASNSSHNDLHLNLKTNPDNSGHPVNHVFITGENDRKSDHVQGLMEFGENSGEPWVRGLTEGEYCDLSVEERLNALVVLISVVNEGNIVRAVLEERLDAANALKKQMWTETQLGKRRMKEECSTKFNDFSANAAADSSQSLLSQSRANDSAFRTAVDEAPPIDPVNIHNDDNYPNGIVSERSLIVHDNSISQIIPSLQHDGSRSERLRMQLKSYIGQRAEEMHVYRSLPLGQDRRRNRYWKFVASDSKHDPGSGRIFVELSDGYWRLIDSEEAFDVLLMSLDTRGLRESHLHVMLQQSESSFKDNLRKNLQSSTIDEAICIKPTTEATDMGLNASGMASSGSGLTPDMQNMSSSLRVELRMNETEKINAFERYQALESWMWKECFNSSYLRAMTHGQQAIMTLLGICDCCLDTYIIKENKCPSCHRTFSTFGNRINYLEPAIQYDELKKIGSENPMVPNSLCPFRIRLIKSLLAFLEVHVLSEAFQSFWMNGRKSWALNLQKAFSVEDILQTLTEFEGGIKRDWLASEFETTTELNSCTFLGKFVGQSDESVLQLPWLPRTSAAVALRLFELDYSIFYDEHQKAEAHKKAEIGTSELPTRYGNMKDVQNAELRGVHQKENRASSGAMRGISACKQVTCSRGSAQLRGRVQKKNHKSRSKSAGRSNKVKKTLTQGLMQQGKGVHSQRQGLGFGHGPRTVRKRRETTDVEEMHLGHFTQVQESGALDDISISHSPKNTNEKWVKEIGNLHDAAGPGNGDSTEASDSDDSADATRYRQPEMEPGTAHRSMSDMVENSDDADVNDIHEFENTNINDVNMNDGSHGNMDESSESSGDYSDSSE